MQVITAHFQRTSEVIFDGPSVAVIIKRIGIKITAPMGT